MGLTRLNGVDLVSHHVNDARFGDRTGASGGVLIVSRTELLDLLRTDPGLPDVRFHIVRPGESVRINGILDVIQPRSKGRGSPQVTFPGIGTAPDPVRSGRTHALQGITVLPVGRLPEGGETFVQEDCLVDMAGPGARYSPFSRGVQLVVEFGRASDRRVREPVAVRRLAAIRVARFLAQRASETGSKDVEEFVSRDPRHDQREAVRVAYVCSVISEGPLHDTLLYGESTERLRPRWISVPELVDGALVSSDFHFSCQRTPTVLYQRNPVVEAIRKKSGLVLEGVILTLRYGSHSEKHKAATRIVEMLRERGVQAVVTHPAVGGNAHIDALDIVRECEKARIPTALVLQEMAGDDGADPGLVDSVPEADLMVSSGNRDQLVDLPGVARTLGPDRLRDGRPTKGPLRLSLRSYLCSTNQVGAHTLTAIDA
ncbi:MAG: hypothetical protein OXF41_20495 [bacterium]|nr:hypothetical protein [bacterium]